MSVHATSISVLCVVCDGTGLAFALNFITTITSSASTNSVISGDQHEQEVVEPDDVLHHRGAGFLKRPFPRRRLAQPPANAAPPVASVSSPTNGANPSNCRPIWPLDILMPLALP